jgi:hypothetical protein
MISLPLTIRTGPTLLMSVLLFAAIGARADDSDDTLRFYLAKSELVIEGQIVSEPFGVSNEAGVVNYPCDFKVSDVLKGDTALSGKTIHVNIIRFEMGEKDKHPLVKKDAACILFLKDASPDKPSRVTADMWFGVQQPSPWMTRSLKRVATEMADRTKEFGIACQRRDDRITARAEGDRVVFDVVSPTGIGSATVTRKGAKWPERLMLRLHLAGLESVAVTSGTVTLSSSVQSHGQFTKQVQWTPDHVEPLDPGLLRAFTSDGKPTDKLPGNGGWFELTFPKSMLEHAGEKLELSWIDFYR